MLVVFVCLVPGSLDYRLPHMIRVAEESAVTLVVFAVLIAIEYLPFR